MVFHRSIQFHQLANPCPATTKDHTDCEKCGGTGKVRADLVMTSKVKPGDTASCSYTSLPAYLSSGWRVSGNLMDESIDPPRAVGFYVTYEGS
jgi:hypothetical protein